MSIGFDKSRWERVKEDNRAWWAGDLKRPLIHIAIGGRDPGRPEPELPNHHFTAFYDLSVSAEAIVDRWDYDLSCHTFFGDAFPSVWPNYGPGAAAAFMGAELLSSVQSGTVWFNSVQEQEISDVHLQYQPENVWLRRVSDIMRAAQERWEGLVQVGMTDLGGSLDILSTFRPSEKLLLDLYDFPEDVQRVNWEAHELWWRYFDELNAILQPANPGYSTWAGIYSETPHYMFQCDFCYMIGPDMFDEFVKPELAASCKRMPNGFYHLDGPGQLPHLDSLLTIPELKGVQWVPGSGVPDWAHWPEVYRKIRDAGKLIQLFGSPDIMDTVSEQLGSAEGITFHTWCASEAEAIDLVKKYGVE